MLNLSNAFPWPLYEIEAVADNNDFRLRANRKIGENDLSKSKGAAMLGSFIGIDSLAAAKVWIEVYGFPWSPVRYFGASPTDDSFEIYFSQVQERAISFSLLTKIVSIACGRSRPGLKHLLAWCPDEADRDYFNMRYSSWIDLPQSKIQEGKKLARDLQRGAYSDLGSLFIGFAPDIANWKGQVLAPPDPEEVPAANDPDHAEYNARSFVDLSPVSIEPEKYNYDFDEIARAAASVVVGNVLNMLLRSVGSRLVMIKTVTGQERLKAVQSFPTPLHSMAYEIFKGINNQKDIAVCLRCGEWFVPRRYDQNSCGKPACSKYAQRNRG